MVGIKLENLKMNLSSDYIKFGNNQIGNGKTFVIAEIGNNHNGSVDRAIQMIDSAVEIGVDCVKFQMRNTEELYRKKSLRKDGEDLGTEYIIDLLQKYDLSTENHKKIFDYCKVKDISYLCTPWDEISLNNLIDFGVDGFKVASADLTNTPLIKKLIETKKPLILSTGMSNDEEIKETSKLLENSDAEFALLHCNSTYPAPFQDINLRYLLELKKIHRFVGYSGHERGISVSLGAVAMGACIIERHFTLDRNMEGPDHSASLTLDEFKQLIEGISELDLAIGQSGPRKLSQGELINRENLGKSIAAATNIKIGTKLLPKHLIIKSPGQGLSPQRMNELVGKIIKRNIKEEEFFFESDIIGSAFKPKNFKFSRPWGIPVRYHDFKFFREISNPDFFEFHLSYNDMNLNPENYLEPSEMQEFVVHAPELFKDSKLMDLTCPDKVYLKESIDETQRVIDITRGLKKFFPRTKKPLIVMNVGGFSMDKPFDKTEVEFYYERLGNSLEKLDHTGVELIPQTMAPFPWHFGGQRYQNLFLNPEEIIKWCNLLNLRICFDISHSALYCNYSKTDIHLFSKQIAPLTAHIHAGDANGVNGEGLQIGKGHINFKKIGEILAEHSPNASFIPEIWQGHKNHGEGFWEALHKLEGIF